MSYLTEKGRKTLKIIGWNIGIFLFLLIAAEMGTRLLIKIKRGSATASMRERTRYLQYEPFVMFGPGWEEKIAAIPTKSYKKRILILGGSTAEALRLTTFEAALKKQNDSLEYEIINLAHGGYNSRQEVIMAALYANQLAPDLIISFDGANDIRHRIRMDEPYTFYLNDAYKQLLMKPATGPLVSLLRNSQFYWSLVRLKKRSEIKEAENYADIIPVYQESVASIHAIANGIGAKHLMVLQPVSIFKNPQSIEEKSFTAYDYRNEAVRMLWIKAENSLSDLVIKKGIIYLNANRLFENNPDYIFRDDVHFADEKGYEIVTDKMAELIFKHQMLR